MPDIPIEEINELARRAKNQSLSAAERKKASDLLWACLHKHAVFRLRLFKFQLEDRRDIAQTAITEVLKKFDKYDPAQGKFTNYFESFLIHKAKKFIEESWRRKVRLEESIERSPILPSVPPDPTSLEELERQAESDGEMALVREILSSYSIAKQRKAFQMRVFEGRSTSAVAKLLAIKKTSVSQYVSRVTGFLAEEMARRKDQNQ